MKNNPALIFTDTAGFEKFSDDGEHALLGLTITKDEIETGKIARVLEVLHVIANTRESVVRYKESLFFIVEGYDSDKRELAEIPKVRSFFFRLVKEWPHWIWFLQRDIGSISLLLSLLCTVKVHKTLDSFGIEFVDMEELQLVMMDLFERGNNLFAAFDISFEEARDSAESATAELFGV